MEDVFPLVLFGLSITSALISCGAAVVSAVKASRPASVELQSTVDELVSLVEKMMKEQRKVKMQNVRSAVKDTGDTERLALGDPASVPGVGQSRKDRLRALHIGRR